MASRSEKTKESEKARDYEDAVGLSSLIQMTMEVQRSIGDLSAKVEELRTSVESLKEETNKRLRPLEKALWAVIGSVAILGLLGWLLAPFLSAFATKIIS